jgi:CheY-like chemotaxis protein
MRFICVDDDPVFLDIIAANLRGQGFSRIECVGSAREVLDLVGDGARQVDCFLVDIQMPEIDGIQLCRALRAIPGYRQTPIVMVTKMSEKGYVDQAFAAGATDYVTKPLDQLEFRSRINMVKRLHDERKRTASLREQQSRFGDDAPKLDFASPALIPAIDNAVEYFALENYLLTLGKVRLFGSSVLAINMSNAQVFHGSCDAGAFLDVLGDVGQSIFEGLKIHQFLISYAGSGNFVIFLSERTEIDTESLECQINGALMQFETTFAMDRLPVPQVTVGPSVSCGIFTTGRPTKMLERSISLAQPNGPPARIAGRLSA